jgi:hypothetical protein
MADEDEMVPKLDYNAVNEALFEVEKCFDDHVEVVLKLEKDPPMIPPIDVYYRKWINAEPYQFDMPLRTSVSVLYFTTFSMILAKTKPESLAHVDGRALLQLGILSKSAPDPMKFTVEQGMECLFAVCDAWQDAIAVKGIREFVYTVMHRMCVCLTEVQSCQVYNDGRFSEELPGIAKRIELEDEYWAKHMQKKRMELLTKHELENEEQDKEKLMGWRETRHKRPNGAFLTTLEVMCRDIFVQLDLNNKRYDCISSPEEVEAVIQKAQHTLVGCHMDTVIELRTRFYYQSQLAPGDIERYHRRAPHLPIKPKAILAAFRPIRIVSNHEGVDVMLHGIEDPCSALALASRAYPGLIKICNSSFIAPNNRHATLRFIGHKLACVVGKKCYFAKDGETPYAVITMYLNELGVRIKLDEQLEKPEDIRKKDKPIQLVF